MERPRQFFADLTVALAAVAFIVVYVTGIISGGRPESVLVKGVIALASVGFIGYLMVVTMEDRATARPGNTPAPEDMSEDMMAAEGGDGEG